MSNKVIEKYKVWLNREIEDQEIKMVDHLVRARKRLEGAERKVKKGGWKSLIIDPFSYNEYNPRQLRNNHALNHIVEIREFERRRQVFKEALGELEAIEEDEGES